MAQKKTTAAQKFKRTISEDLFTSWENNKRPGDATRIKNITGRCYPVVQRALKYGYVMDSSLSDQINNYFLDRKSQEAAAAEKIKN